MNYLTFLERIIDDGIEAAKADYKDDAMRLKGSVAGFEACRGKMPNEIFDLMQQAHAAAARAHLEEATNFWELRCYEAEIDWVGNCVSVVLVNQGGQALTSYFPTARAYTKAVEVLGYVSSEEPSLDG